MGREIDCNCWWHLQAKGFIAYGVERIGAPAKVEYEKKGGET